MTYKKAKKIRPKRKPSLRLLDKKLWKVFSEFIRRRDSDEGGTANCISCGILKYWKEGDCGHYISRSYAAVKYDEMNNHFQCKSCNGFREGNKDDYRKAMVSRYGEQAVTDLEHRKHLPHKVTAADVEELIKTYSEKLKEFA